MRLIFSNLAAFPLVAFILVFARVLVETIPLNPNPQSVFVPPLVGNPNAAAFNVLMAFGAILIAPTIPAMIREKMGAKPSNFGPTIAAGVGAAAGAATAPATKTWAHLNRYNSRTGHPQGFLAIKKAQIQTRLLGGTRRGQQYLRRKYGGFDPLNPRGNPPNP